MANTFVEHEIIPLRSNPDYSEKWVQDIIAKKPSILRMGDLILRDRERLHPGAGRLDLLFQDSEINLRYELKSN
jgi:hypothetical protein